MSTSIHPIHVLTSDGWTQIAYQGPVGPQGEPGPVTFLADTGPPTAGVGVDGAIYLDTATGRLYGPKAAGAWPGTPLGRIVPLTPTYDDLKAG